VKLASLNEGRDGRLVVVDRALARATEASHVAATLQGALDRWHDCEPVLRALAEALETRTVDSFPFEEAACASPLPRAYQWIDGSAYVNHVELLRRSRGGALPESFWREPLVYQGGSDGFNPPRAPIRAVDEAHGVDFEAEIAVVTDDVPMGVTRDAAAGHVKLLMLVNDVSLRRLIPPELEKGFGFLVGKPATTFSPVAVTPDELGTHLRDGGIDLPLCVDFNGTAFGRARPDVDCVFTFADLIAHAASTRDLGAGTIVGGGTVSNRRDGTAGLPVAEGGAGYSCIAEQRAVETLRTGSAKTPFMRFGDRVRIEMRGTDGRSIFGAIDQTCTAARKG
jgi:fumarylacetoacetate (FAA) hydrolase